MNYTKIDLKEHGTLTCCEHTRMKEMPDKERPALLVLPGGAYEFCSEREGEPVALWFYGRGYNTYVLEYPIDEKAKYPDQLVAAAYAMHTIRARAKETRTDTTKVFAMGFSAGGHLCGCLLNCDPALPCVKAYDFKPNGGVLCYPVIGGDKTHSQSFKNLLKGQSVPWLDLLTSGRSDNPPAFVWTTADDDAVPAVNSIAYAKAYADKGLKYALHIFPHGRHGLSLADSATNADLSDVDPHISLWAHLADAFLKTL
ncbi:MAG: alpha/beta hydrolase [Clostridiales bacterium]|nr:alpha/beta hydrolase [Clostridiales bacterium]